MRLIVRNYLRPLFDFLGNPELVFVLLMAVAVLAFLTGCAAPSLHSVNGPIVEAPTGYTQYCTTYPARAECGGTE